MARVLPALGDKRLDEIKTPDIERFLGSLLAGTHSVSPATRNRYRDLLSGFFERAQHQGLVTTNPVTGVPKLKEPAGRVM